MPAAALAQGRAQRQPGHPLFASSERCTGLPRRFPFQCAAADGARLPARPDQHGRARLARGRAAGFGHHDPGDPAMFGDGIGQGGAIKAHAATPLARATAASTASGVAGA